MTSYNLAGELSQEYISKAEFLAFRRKLHQVLLTMVDLYVFDEPHGLWPGPQVQRIKAIVDRLASGMEQLQAETKVIIQGAESQEGGEGRME